MENNFFNPEEDNVALSNLSGYLDGNGILRLKDSNISSYNFDGMIPLVLYNITASAALPGMRFSLTGSAGEQTYYTIVSVANEDIDLDVVLSGKTVIEYLDDKNLLQSLSIGASSSIVVIREDWSNKFLGSNGWYLSSDGNGIFSNVAVRGRIEATEGKIDGDLTLGGSFTASTNNGQLILSSSGIFGSTASGSFHLDNIDGEISFTGDITANSGVIKKLTVGAGKTYPIINFIGAASVTPFGGNFILSMNSNSTKRFYAGDYFYINGIVPKGKAYADGYEFSASPLFNKITVGKDGTWSSPYTYKIITASYNTGTSIDSYFCTLQQSGLFVNYDFSNLTASSGSINFGYVYFGEYASYGLTGTTYIDGMVFSTIGPGTFFQNYIPDYIDLNGRFRLGKGNVVFDGTSLDVTGDIYATGGEISGDLAIVDGGQIYVGNNKNSGQRINIRHTDMTGYSELGYPIFSLVTGSAVSASPILESGGFDDLSPGTNPDPPWGTFWGFTAAGGTHTATVDSVVYKDGGQSARVSSSALGGINVSAMTQRVDNLIPGDTYTVSAWVYANKDLIVANDTYVDIWLLSSSTSAGGRPDYFTTDTRYYSILGATAVASAVWTKLSAKLTVPTSPYAYHSLHLRTQSASGTRVWWDTVELTKTNIASTISGLYFNDGELFSDNIKVVSDGNIILGNMQRAAIVGSLPDPTDIPDIIKLSGSDTTYRLWVGHINTTKAGFAVTKTGHVKAGLITSSATYNRTDTTAYVSISSAGVLGRYSSTQRIKYDIIPINTLLGPSIDNSKIISGSPSINYKNILSLTPVEYSLLDHPDNRKFGFIAEDVADKLPEIATYDDDGPTYFDMAGLIAATLAVVQDQQKIIEDLQNRVLQLESQLGG